MSERCIRAAGLPRHIAVIMDGNGRWAEQRGLCRVEGHRAGIESAREIVRAAHELGISLLTLYAFSTENWNRPRNEVEELMGMLEHYLDVELREVVKNRIRIRAIGRLDRLPESLQRKIRESEERTRENREMQVVFAISYGGRAELVDAARKLLRDAELGKISVDHLDEKTFAAYLYAPDLPDPDLLIRTGAEARISNFLLWQLAYAELHLTDVMWPDFRKSHLVDAVEAFQRRERRYGLTPDQARERGPEGA